MGKSGAALPVFLFTSAAIAVSFITYLQFNKKDSRKKDDDEENRRSSTENNVQRGSTSDVDTSIIATPQIKPIKQPHDANNIDVLDLTLKSANTSQPTEKDAAATDTNENAITPSSSTPTKEESKKKKKIRPKIKPIITPQESDNVEAFSSDSNTATSPKDSGEEVQGREVSIRTELGFGEFAHSPPRSRSTSKKSLKSSSSSKTGSNNDEDEAPKEGANYTEISKYWKSQSTKNKFKAPEKSDAAIRVGSVASSSVSSSNTSGITATVTDDADVHVSQEDVEETNAEKSPETTQGSEKEEVAAFAQEQPSAEVDKEEKDEESGEVKAEEVGVAASTLRTSPQARKEEDVSKEKATEALEQQSPEEKLSEKINNTVAEVDQSMTQDTDENFKTVVDEEVKAKPEELEEEETQEEEDSQLIVPAASGSGSDSSGGDSNTNTSRSGSPSEDGYVKIVRNTLGVPMSESEFLSAPVAVTDKNETHEETTADVEEEGGQDGGNDIVTSAAVTGQPQDVKEQEGNEKVNEEKEGLEKKQDEQQVVDNADVGDVNPDGTTEANSVAKSSGTNAAGGKTTPKKNNKKKKKRKGKKK